jgi:hypothetical protein
VSNFADRFWSKVEKGPGCWLWTGPSFREGTGQVGGRMGHLAHRVAWTLTFGRPPFGMLRTTCGDLRCVRPDHHVDVARKDGPLNLARTPAVRFDAMVSRGPDCWL